MMFQPGKHNLIPTTTIGPIKTWSFSSLTKFEQCPYAAFLSKVRGLKEPAGPAADRGSRIHNAYEAFIRGESDDLTDAGKKPVMSLAQSLREAFLAGMCEVENEWCFDVEWNVCEPKTDAVWAVFKLDAFVREDNNCAIVWDHKSGKSFGNELKHGDQGLLYCIAAMVRYPELQYVEARFHYCDEGEIKVRCKLTRDELNVFLPRLNKRALRMTTATDFPPVPSKPNCKWCRYKEMRLEEDNRPACEWGVIN